MACIMLEVLFILKRFAKENDVLVHVLPCKSNLIPELNRRQSDMHVDSLLIVKHQSIFSFRNEATVGILCFFWPRSTPYLLLDNSLM